MEDIQEVNEEVVTPVIGEFKPKKKFLNFVAGVNGARIRLISDIAFIKGEKLSGLGLENVVFKITICDEGTINFEEVDTNVTDKAYRQRLIDDICDSDVTGYTKKFIVAGLEFANKDGDRCYLEVEEAKPIDKLKSLFPEEQVVSTKGLSFLDELLGDSSDESNDEVEVAECVVETQPTEVETKNAAQLLMEESFKKMNDDKVNELKSRIEEKELEIKKAKSEIANNERKLKDSSDKLRVLTTRLETMSPADEPNGFVFLVSDEQKSETGLDENTKSVTDKIADLMNLKKDVLFDHLTEGFYQISIGKKGDIQNKLESIEKDILEKITSIDPMGKFSMSDTNMVEYRGELNWHQLVAKMIRKGFEQDEEFDKISGSNSYETKTEDDGGSYTGTKDTDPSTHVCGDTCNHSDNLKNDTSTQSGFKTKLLTTIDTPQDIIIIGMGVDGVDSDFSITDDYSSFDINIGDNKSHTIESDGFVTILTLKEFLDFQKKNEDEFESIVDGSTGAVFLQNFSGDIRLGVKDEEGNSNYEFGLGDYIQHQLDEYVDIIVDLPVGTKAIEINDKNLTSLLRDGKINDILS